MILGGERKPQPQTVAALSIGETANPFQVFVSPRLFPFDVLALAHIAFFFEDLGLPKNLPYEIVTPTSSLYLASTWPPAWSPTWTPDLILSTS